MIASKAISKNRFMLTDSESAKIQEITMAEKGFPPIISSPSNPPAPFQKIDARMA